MSAIKLTNDSSNLTSGSYYYYQDQWYPIYTPTITTISTSNLPPYITIEKVENGFVIIKDYKKYVITDAKEIVKYLKDGNGTK